MDVFSQAATLATPLDHLVGDLLGGGCNQIVRFQPQFREKTGQGLFAEIAFEVLIQDQTDLTRSATGKRTLAAVAYLSSALR